MPKFIFSPKYVINIGDHVFPTLKFQRVAELLRDQDVAQPQDFVEPAAFTREDLLLAHTSDWVDRVLEGRLTLDEEADMELPWSHELAFAHALAAAGTILACRHALETGVGLHIGGGSHHAFPDHGEGFCVFNDIACGILKMRKEKRIRRAAVVDLDVHQGNGTNAIFSKIQDVFTFSMHQGNIYPTIKTPGSRDIDLYPGTGNREYLDILEKELPPILDRHKPELVVYQAGVDCHEKDLLGGLKITKDGMRRRDETVFRLCRERRIPVVVTLGGGYAAKLEDTVVLHAQTLRLAVEILRDPRNTGAAIPYGAAGVFGGSSLNIRKATHG